MKSSFCLPFKGRQAKLNKFNKKMRSHAKSLEMSIYPLSTYMYIHIMCVTKCMPTVFANLSS